MLPKEFLQRMEAQLGEEYDAYLEAMERPPVRGLRFLGDTGQREGFLRAAPWRLSPIPYAGDGFTLRSPEKLGRHPLHHLGLIYLQEPGAMLPLSCLPLREGDRVLDLCAAPGGKSLQALARIGKSGLLISNEVVPGRNRVLAGNLERCGAKNAAVICAEAEVLADAWPEAFDAVIVDAPCSGEGMFRKDEGAVAQWSQTLVDSCAKRQEGLLAQAARLLRPGGYLLYSTCTFSPEENEGAAAHFLEVQHREGNPFALCPLPETAMAACRPGDTRFGEEMALCARFYPHTGEGEGQFAALFRREGDAPRREYPARLPFVEAQVEKAARAFLLDTLGRDDLPLCQEEKGKGGEVSLFLPPEGMLSSQGLRFEAPGVPLGTVRKGRLIPHHWFFKAYGGQCLRTLELLPGDERLLAYLRGEELSVPGFPEGYGALLCMGACAGGFKASKGRIKNHYPKGLRNP